jgi:Zn-dependent peptidase ImmA (M78 family)
VNEFDDYPVTPRSDEDMEELAAAIRKQLGMSDADILTAREMLERLRDLHGVEIVVRSDVEMGRREAYVTSKPDRIFLADSTHRSILRDEARARMTVAHEAMHFFVHPGVPKARAADGNKTPKFIKPHESAERQARVGAAALLMPRHILKLANSARELQMMCGVSLQAAEIRFTQWARKTKGRPELPFVRAHLDHLKSLTERRGDGAKAAKLREARSLWETLSIIEGEDSSRYRMCTHRTYRVAWSEFERMTECGWFVRNNEVVAWMAIRP